MVSADLRPLLLHVFILSCLLQLWSEFSFFYLEFKSYFREGLIGSASQHPFGSLAKAFGLIVSVAPVQCKEFFYLSQHEENIFLRIYDFFSFVLCLLLSQAM